MSDCTICGRWYPSGKPHACPPRWRVWTEDEDDGDCHGRIVYATSAEAAAEACVDSIDEVADGDQYTVGVQRTGQRQIERFTVTASLRMTYSVRGVE